MPYLQAVIYESMRLFPANGLPLARVSPRERMQIIGHYFGPGVQLRVYSWALHRNKNIFGEDALQFKPERWQDKERSRDQHRAFFSFGYRARACLGRHLAWMELSKGASTFFKRYDVRLEEPDMDWIVEGSFIKGQRNIKMILQLRQYGQYDCSHSSFYHKTRTLCDAVDFNEHINYYSLTKHYLKNRGPE